MNKYASGYTLVDLISVIGGIVILGSLVGGIAIGFVIPGGSGFLGFVVFIAGVIQGVVLLGLGAVGEAILDGSIAQQESVSNLQKLRILIDSELKKTNPLESFSDEKVAEPRTGDASLAALMVPF